MTNEQCQSVAFVCTFSFSRMHPSLLGTQRMRLGASLPTAIRVTAFLPSSCSCSSAAPPLAIAGATTHSATPIHFVLMSSSPQNPSPSAPHRQAPRRGRPKRPPNNQTAQVAAAAAAAAAADTTPDDAQSSPSIPVRLAVEQESAGRRRVQPKSKRSSPAANVARSSSSSKRTGQTKKSLGSNPADWDFVGLPEKEIIQELPTYENGNDEEEEDDDDDVDDDDVDDDDNFVVDNADDGDNSVLIYYHDTDGGLEVDEGSNRYFTFQLNNNAEHGYNNSTDDDEIGDSGFGAPFHEEDTAECLGSVEDMVHDDSITNVSDSRTRRPVSASNRDGQSEEYFSDEEARNMFSEDELEDSDSIAEDIEKVTDMESIMQDVDFLEKIGRPSSFLMKNLVRTRSKSGQSTRVVGNEDDKKHTWQHNTDEWSPLYIENDDEDEDDVEFNYCDDEVDSDHAVVHVPTVADPEKAVFGESSFSALGLSQEISAALATTGITRPTNVQVRGIPPIMGGADVIIGAATGSGKTLTYLLPVIESLKAAEALRKEGDPPLRVPHRPRAIIVVPTRELADQVLDVTKELSHLVKFRVIGTNAGAGGAGLSKLKAQLAKSPVDLMVSTTGRLLQLLSSRSIDLRFTRHVIVDEVDTMFDTGFGPELRKILTAVRGHGGVINKPQYIAVGATHPSAAEEMYEQEFPSAKRIDVDLHVVPPGLEARFIRTTADGKIPELIALLGECQESGHLRGGRVIVFCNTISSARFVGHFLSESGYTVSSVHGEIPPERREAEYNAFKSGQTQLIVCTDVAARGLDNLEIAHVIIFDFPTSAVDYLHRAGRTARAGASGKVTSFVLKRDLALARAIERASIDRDDTLVSARKAREEEKARKIRDQTNLALQEREAQAKLEANFGRQASRNLISKDSAPWLSRKVSRGRRNSGSTGVQDSRRRDSGTVNGASGRRYSSSSSQRSHESFSRSGSNGSRVARSNSYSTNTDDRFYDNQEGIDQDPERRGPSRLSKSAGMKPSSSQASGSRGRGGRGGLAGRSGRGGLVGRGGRGGYAVRSPRDRQGTPSDGLGGDSGRRSFGAGPGSRGSLRGGRGRSNRGSNAAGGSRPFSI